MRNVLALLVLSLLFLPAESADDDINLIDKHLEAAWKKKGITPAPIAEDAEFLRRVCVDLVGQIPDSWEAREFIFSRRENKREAKVEELLKSWWFARTMSERMTAYMVGYPRQFDYFTNYKAFRKYLHKTLEGSDTNNYQEIAREILTAKTGGGAQYVRQFSSFGAQGGQAVKIEQLTARTSEAFLGYNIRCAQCHDHPFDKWSQEEFFGMAGFFARVTIGQNGVSDRKGDIGYKFEEWKHKIEPKYYDGREPESGYFRRDFAEFVVNDRQFARAFVNRVWAWFFGRGIVDPIDKFKDKNRPLFPKLLEALTDDFINNEYDIRLLVRTIVLSRAYQRTSATAGENDDDVRLAFARARLRPMTPEQMFHSVSHATGLYPDKRRGLAGAHLKDEDIWDMMGGDNTTKETKKYYVIRAWLIDMLIRTSDESTITNYTKYTANIQQVLHMLNKELPLFSGARTGTGGTLDAMLDRNWTRDEIFAEMFLATLSRFPTKSEKKRLAEHVKNSKSKKTAYEEIFWALMNTDEFIFNH